ncbi:type III pantothenate kinase [Aquimarina sp. BL5]|uniref:type III pantothenate kinase n=1 Tax=Aquimarina sp. BL5 TaxID=1714860 RepID=UPI000E52E994|nr:type III pantothenate kinase [Aquimarina sp. BL5]AXT52505.1 type III pantothenate kinase [Aquimarina sp. BL5]RKN08480.1 type III pantothenate kinase [Aquimarina sp. BL5]
MNLVIDVGNTSIKIGVFLETSMIHKETLKSENFNNVIQKVRNGYPLIKRSILSSVSNIKEEDVILLKSLFDVSVLDHTLMMPFKNLYATPTTLGVDRLALVAASVHQFPAKDALIIDAGTCITYDFKNKKEEYLGGAIAPGLRLRYTSLNSFTSKLPLLELESPKNHIGDTTNEAIHSGVVNGVLYEIEGAIAEYCNTYPNLTVILTGGDAHFLSKRLKNSIFATSNFLLEGLNHILAFNNSQ